jgi:hypothetical protein
MCLHWLHDKGRYCRNKCQDKYCHLHATDHNGDCFILDIPIEIFTQHMPLTQKARRNLRKTCSYLHNISLPSFYDSRTWKGFCKVCAGVGTSKNITDLRNSYWHLPQFARIHWSRTSILYYKYIDTSHLVTWPDVT